MSRKIKVVSISMAMEFRNPRTWKDNLKYLEGIVKEAGKINPDIIVIPELFAVANLDDHKQVCLNNSPDKKLLTKLAKKYRTYIIGSIYEKRDDKIYNTALIINRNGKIVGRYDKIHPTESEIAKCVVPGSRNQLPVETEFGKIGAQICFDANWEEEWRKLANAGVKLIAFSSAFPGGKILTSLALLNNVYVIPAIWSLHSGIIDNMGKWLIQTDRYSRWVWTVIDLEKTVFHLDGHETKIKAIYKKYKDKIKIETFMSEGLFTLESNVKEISIQNIIKEFNLVTFRDYIDRCTKAQDAVRIF